MCYLTLLVSKNVIEKINEVARGSEFKFFKTRDVLRFLMCKLVMVVDFVNLKWAVQVKHYFWASSKVLPNETSI